MKKLKSLFIALMVCLTLTHSRPSQAAVGAIFSPALVTAGLYMTGGWLVSIPVGIGIAAVEPNSQTGVGVHVLLLGFISLLVGIVVLDGEQVVSYSPLTTAQSKKLGITSAELQSFNSEIDQVNALVSYVDSELEQMNKPNAEKSAQVWNSVKDQMAPETYAALIKVTRQIYE